MGGKVSSVELVYREEWGALEPKSLTQLNPPMSKVIIHHTAAGKCTTKEECVEEVKKTQRVHMYCNAWDDIGYNFLVGEDGRVYEGRGWYTLGSHSMGHNTSSYGICVMGNFMEELPNDKALSALKEFINYGVQKGKLTEGYELFGHRDAQATDCPGLMLYNHIQTWSNFSHRNLRD
ncbi:peptidoglycan-recognition protein SC2-like isoform X2 [Homarus americanus]|nr:peptidoglycan-recognition protein SC2-like isoform X2 [Homarus americanus]